MSNSNQRKAETLGMPHGTANSRLRRNIIFELLTGTQWMDWGVCYKCKDAIMSPEELCIEHKQPWEGRENGKELYWDLDNIDFSHKRCNVPHVSGSVKRRKIGPPNTAWCATCKQFLSVEDFWKGPRWNGLALECKDCKKAADKVDRPERYGTVAE